MKKVEKTTRPFRYDLNLIPYDYTVEVRNRFKGLDLIDRVPDELWTEVHDIVQETVIPKVRCLCPVYSKTMFWLLSLQETMIYKDRMLEMETGFSVLLWQSQDIAP